MVLIMLDCFLENKIHISKESPPPRSPVPKQDFQIPFQKRTYWLCPTDFHIRISLLQTYTTLLSLILDCESTEKALNYSNFQLFPKRMLFWQAALANPKEWGSTRHRVGQLLSYRVGCKGKRNIKIMSYQNIMSTGFWRREKFNKVSFFYLP